MAYATVTDVEGRINRTISDAEKDVCALLLDDAAVMIDIAAASAADTVKKVVSCRMVIRALGDGDSNGYPIGVTQGSMTGLGYSQSWTTGGGGTNGELYLSKTDKQMLGVGNRMDVCSPVEDLVEKAVAW